MNAIQKDLNTCICIDDTYEFVPSSFTMCRVICGINSKNKDYNNCICKEPGFSLKPGTNNRIC